MCHTIKSTSNNIAIDLQDDILNPTFVGLKYFILLIRHEPQETTLISPTRNFNYNSVIRLTPESNYIKCIKQLNEQNVKFEIYTIPLNGQYLQPTESIHITPSLLKTGYHITSFQFLNGIINYPCKYIIDIETCWDNNDKLYMLLHVMIAIMFSKNDIIFYDGGNFSVKEFRFMKPEEHSQLLNFILTNQQIDKEQLISEYAEIYSRIENIVRTKS